MSKTKQKILLLLFSGVAFSYAFTPSRQQYILREAKKEWGFINKKSLIKDMGYLSRQRLVERKYDENGCCEIKITDKGKKTILKEYFKENRFFNNKNWDGKWRIVFFDVPEKNKRRRNAFRDKIKEIGFYELQKSVFVFPYKCEEEMLFIIESYCVEKYVNFGTLESINNEDKIKNVFRLK